MKNKTEKKVLYIFTICILAILPFVSTLTYYFARNNIEFKSIFSNPTIIMYISIPFFIYIYISNIIKTKKIDKYDILFYIMTIVGVFACIFAINKNNSIFGSEYRHDGFLTMLTYNLLFINWKRLGSSEDAKNIIKIIIYITIINCIYGILQVYTDFPFIVRLSRQNFASGFCTHNNFFGSLLVTSLSIMTCKFFIDKKFKIVDIIVIILFIFNLLICESTGPFLAYIITLIFIFIYLIVKKSLVIKKLIVFLILSIILVSSYLFYNIKYNEGKCDLCNVVANSVETGGNGRLIIWKDTLGVIKQNFIIGVGYDNLINAYPNPVAFPRKNGEVEYNIIDNAHNVYLNNLVSNGILGFIPYMLLCLFTFIKGLKSKGKITFILLSGFVAYSVQAFSNLSVIQVAPIYYVLIGLILSDKSIEKTSVKN